MKVLKVAVPGFVLVVAAACGSGSTLGHPHAAATRGPSTSVTSTTSPEKLARDRYAAALRSLKQSRTITYVVNSHLDMGGGEVLHIEREVAIDAAREIASTRVRMSTATQGEQTSDLRFLLVSTADRAFLTMPAWTGSRRGKRMQFTEKTAREMGVPLVLSAPTVVPPGLDDVEVTGLSASGSILGTVDATAGFDLLGMTGFRKDADLASSLIGRVPIRVTVDRYSGALVSIDVGGQGHTVVDTSGSMSPELLDDLLSAAYSTVTIKRTGEPADITEPASEDILSG